MNLVIIILATLAIGALIHLYFQRSIYTGDRLKVHSHVLPEEEVIAEEVKGIPSAIAGAVTEADYSRYNPWQMLPDEYLPEHKADGGIMMLAKGTDIAGGGLTLGRAFLNKVKNNPKLQNKDGGPKKSTK